jgi:RNA polymerase sigma factor (sigma-70 family)
MAAIPLTNVIDHLRSLAVDELSDKQLLDRFTRTADEAAFTTLVRRHGPLVLGVCRRMLGAGPDLDDAFQATFVVLARKAAGIRRQTAVASWLYGVAYRLSLKLRAGRSRRKRHENPLQQLAETRTMRVDPAARASLSELGLILDEELQRLPAGCRDALVLCHMEGLSNAEAAEQLGWPLGTLKGRVQRGRQLLRQRLERRGVALSALGLTVALKEQASAAVPAALVRLAVHSLSPAAVSGRVTALAAGALEALTSAKLKLTVFAALTLGLVGLAAMALALPADPSCKPAEPAAVESQTKETPDATDAFGDPLPPGALARLGTIRWRHGAPVTFLALLPDGKTVVSAADDRFVRVWDQGTGRELRRIGPGPDIEPRGGAAMIMPGPAFRLPSRVTAAVSRDGKMLACHFDEPAIQLWEIATGKSVGSIPLGKDNFQPGNLAFAPNSKQLAIAGVNGPVRLWDFEAGKVVRELGRAAREMVPVVAATQSALAYAPDGKTLVSALAEVENMAFTNRVRFWDPETGKELCTFALESRFGVISPVFSADSKQFAFATNDGEVYHLQAATAKLLHKWKLPSVPNWPSLVFSSDGTKLYSKSAVEENLREWDVKTGKELRRLGDASSTAVMHYAGLGACLILSPNGKTLAAGGGGNTIRFIDVASGKMLPGPGGHSHGLVFLSFGADGNSVLTRASDRTMRLWNANTGKEVKELAVLSSAYNVTVTADGRYLAHQDDKLAIIVTDLANGKEVANISKPGQNIATFFFAPDGSRLVVQRLQESEDVVYEVPSGKELCRIAVGGGGPAAADSAVALFFTPDSKRLAVYSLSGRLTIHDAASGKVVQQIQLADPAPARSGAFSPDGRTVALDLDESLVKIVELATGQERSSIGKKIAPQPAILPPAVMTVGYFRGAWPAGSATVGYSPDGRLLAHAGLDNALEIWDLATGKSLARFPGHQGPIGAVVFAADGSRVATASGDTSALIWNIQSLRAKAGPAPQVLEAGALPAHWDALGSSKAALAHEAMNSLVAAPKQAVPFLREKLPPTEAIDARRIEQLIDQLDSKDFKTRQQAHAELLKVGEQAVPRLEKVLKGDITLEARQRLEAVRAKLTAATYTGDRLQLLRAVEVLERIGSPEARQVLQTLADGAPGALGTSQAQGALVRLKVTR